MKNDNNIIKKVIITGSSSGIGLATARIFSARGHKVFGIDISKPMGTIEGLCHISCDVTNSQKVQFAIDKIATEQGSIDILVSNAGVHFSANIEDTSDKDFYRVLNINFAGCFFTVRSVLKYMREQRKGSVVLIGSDQSLIGKKNSVIYGATKGAIVQMAKCLALDYAQYGIRVNCVCPGTINTPLYRHAIEKYSKKSGINLKKIEKNEASMQPLDRIGEPSEVADLIYFISSDQAKFITGGTYMIDGGYTAQ